LGSTSCTTYESENSGIGGFIWGFSFWNNRGKAAAGTDVVTTSPYGRPLVSKAQG